MKYWLEYPGYQTIIEQVTISPGSYITFQRTLVPVQTQTITATRTTGTPPTSPSVPPITPSATATTRSTPVSLPVIIGSISVALLALGVKARYRKIIPGWETSYTRTELHDEPLEIQGDEPVLKL